jgi:hypothetical protein
MGTDNASHHLNKAGVVVSIAGIVLTLVLQLTRLLPWEASLLVVAYAITILSYMLIPWRYRAWEGDMKERTSYLRALLGYVHAIWLVAMIAITLVCMVAGLARGAAPGVLAGEVAQAIEDSQGAADWNRQMLRIPVTSPPSRDEAYAVRFLPPGIEGVPLQFALRKVFEPFRSVFTASWGLYVLALAVLFVLLMSEGIAETVTLANVKEQTKAGERDSN